MIIDIRETVILNWSDLGGGGRIYLYFGHLPIYNICTRLSLRFNLNTSIVSFFDEKL